MLKWLRIKSGQSLSLIKVIFSFIHKSSSPVVGSKRFFLDLKNVGASSYYASMMLRMAEAGYEVHLKYHRQLFVQLADPYRGMGLVKHPRVHMRWNQIRHGQEQYIYFYDMTPQAGAWQSSTALSPEIFHRLRDDNLSSSEIYYPFDIHHRWLPASPQDLKKERQVRIAFVGQMDPDTYSNTAVSSYFGLPERWDSIQQLSRGDWPIRWARSASDYRQSSEMLFGGFGHPERSLVTPPDYLGLLGHCEFFLCLPGINIPHSHHLIEAMMCGAIPILSYSYLMPAGLKDGFNCLCFTDQQSLELALKRALSMAKEERQSMRAAALKYYEDILSQDARQAIFEACAAGQVKTLRFAATRLSIAAEA